MYRTPLFRATLLPPLCSDAPAGVPAAAFSSAALPCADVPAAGPRLRDAGPRVRGAGRRRAGARPPRPPPASAPAALPLAHPPSLDAALGALRRLGGAGIRGPRPGQTVVDQRGGDAAEQA